MKTRRRNMQRGARGGRAAVGRGSAEQGGCVRAGGQECAPPLILVLNFDCEDALSIS